MKKLALITASLLITTQGFCALSAYSQGNKEIKEILDNPELRSNFSQGYPISEIKLVEAENEYRIYSVTAGDKTVFAKLTYIKSARLGPRQYEIEISAGNDE